ncbi:unnamed protein product, partial [Urochloa humidicola]
GGDGKKESSSLVFRLFSPPFDPLDFLACDPIPLCLALAAGPATGSIDRSMGRLLLVSLPATGAVIYRCKHCGTHLAYATDIISRMFRCKNGKAYLLDKMVNVTDGEKDDRMMTTGMHTVCDIFCVACGSMVGWKYLAAVEKTQRYKVGKFLLDRAEVLAAVAGGAAAAGTTATTASSGDEDDDPQPSDEDSD